MTDLIESGGRRRWRCDGCGGNGEWGPDWSWWGSDILEGNGMRLVYCSPACRPVDVRAAWKQKYGRNIPTDKYKQTIEYA